MTNSRRLRGRRESEAPEPAESDLVAKLRLRAWEWLTRCPSTMGAPPPDPRAPTVAERPVHDGGSAPEPPARAPADEAPVKKKRAPKREAPAPDASAALRRKAWWWLRSRTPAGSDAERPKRRKGKREAPLSAGVVDLRRRSWAWFAPRAIGEAAPGTHAPVRAGAPDGEISGGAVVRGHLKGVLEALVFASETPLPARELARIARADLKLVKTLLAELTAEYQPRGMRLDEVAGGFVFRTSPVFAPFVREQVAKKPVKMSRAQIETLAIVAYRQPVTRPEIDEVRGVDSGAVLKSLLERHMVRIIGKKDEPGRPMLYGTTGTFLELFGLKALGDLPALREFTELTDESKRAYERELGDEPPAGGAAETGLMGGEGEMRSQAKAVDVAALEEDPTLEGEAKEARPEPTAEVTSASEVTLERQPDDEDQAQGDEDEDDEDEDDEDEDEDDEDDEDEDEDDDDDDDDEG